jgi:hypothetical protein
MAREGVDQCCFASIDLADDAYRQPLALKNFEGFRDELICFRIGFPHELCTQFGQPVLQMFQLGANWARVIVIGRQSSRGRVVYIR